MIEGGRDFSISLFDCVYDVISTSLLLLPLNDAVLLDKLEEERRSKNSLVSWKVEETGISVGRPLLRLDDFIFDVNRLLRRLTSPVCFFFL